VPTTLNEVVRIDRNRRRPSGAKRPREEPENDLWQILDEDRLANRPQYPPMATMSGATGEGLRSPVFVENTGGPKLNGTYYQKR
jgi:hypothetical protein